MKNYEIFNRYSIHFFSCPRNLLDKYGKRLIHSATKLGADAIKTSSKRVVLNQQKKLLF